MNAWKEFYLYTFYKYGKYWSNFSKCFSNMQIFILYKYFELPFKNVLTFNNAKRKPI